MKLLKDGTEAKVIFPFFDIGKDEVNVAGSFDEGWNYSEEYAGKALYKRIIQGPSQAVYARAARVASKIGLSDERTFNYRWNRTLLNLLNKPSENKTMINLGVYKPKDQSGLYNIKNTAELLRGKVIASGITSTKLAEEAGINESSVHRHLSGAMDISRDAAFKYAKVLGCDPSELLFNSLQVCSTISKDTQAVIKPNQLLLLDFFTITYDLIFPFCQ